MLTDRVFNFDVVPLCWFRWTVLSALASKFDSAWFVLHFLDELEASFWVLYETKGDFYDPYPVYLLKHGACCSSYHRILCVHWAAYDTFLDLNLNYMNLGQIFQPFFLFFLFSYLLPGAKIASLQVLIWLIPRASLQGRDSSSSPGTWFVLWNTLSVCYRGAPFFLYTLNSCELEWLCKHAWPELG